MNEQLAIYLLKIRGWVKITIETIMCKLFYVKEVKVVDGDNIKDVTWNYYFVQFLNRIRIALDRLIESCDTKADKCQIIVRNGNKPIILDKNIQKEDVTLTQMFEKVNNIEHISKMSHGYIFTKFELKYADDKTICLRKFLEIYKEVDEVNHHTLENILQFNMIEYDPECKIVVEYFKDGKFLKTEIDVNELYDKHINKALEL